MRSKNIVRVSWVVLVVLLGWPLASRAQPSGLEISDVEPTVLFLSGSPMRQVALVKLLNTGGTPLVCTFHAEMGGEVVDLPGTIVPIGSSTERVPVPDIAVPQRLRLEVKGADGSALASTSRNWSPQRKWKVYLVASSHKDVGYEDFIDKEQREFANYIDIARWMSSPGRGDYRYTMENLLFMHVYMDERSEEAWRDLVEQRVKSGRMPLMGAPSGVHTHWMDYEELARVAYPARREAADRFGLEIKTFMIADNPSLSWSGAEVLADAGFRYVARWGQGWRTGGNNDYARTKVPALFWWMAPDKIHKVLFAWRSHYGLSFWYGQQESGYGPPQIELGSLNVNAELKSVEDGSKLGPYPYDALIVPSYVDMGVPHIDGRALPEWRKQYAYPEIQIADPTEFFVYMEKRYGSELPTLAGDLNNFSGDYATIDPESQGWKRDASRILPVAEGLAALRPYLDSSFGSIGGQVSAIWDQIHEYDEHTWPTQPKASDFQLFNASWIKKQGAERADDSAHSLVDSGLASLAAGIRTDNASVVVFNSLAHRRDGVVDYAGHCAAIEDLTTRAISRCGGRLGSKTRFIARDVPAYGYKLYRVVAEPVHESDGIAAYKDRIANQFYEIRFSPVTGNVISIRDKTSGREFVNTSGRYEFNQMVYVHKNGSLAKDGFEHSPAKAKELHSYSDGISATFESVTDDAATGATIRQSVTLYEGLPEIYITDEMQHAAVMFSNRYEDRYRENIFFAFPFNIPGGQPRAEYPGGVVRPYLDQLRWGSHDYLTANRWADVSNRDYGMTIAPVEEQVMEFGGIRYNELSVDYQPKNSDVFSYAWSNRMAGLLTLGPDDCNATFHYALRPHSGDWDTGDTVGFGWSVASPLLAKDVKSNPTGAMTGSSRSFLDLDAPNVELTVLKESERPGEGFVVRLVETEGKPTSIRLHSSLIPLAAAHEADLVENSTRELPVSGGTVEVSVPAFGFVTLSLSGSSAAPKAMGEVTASPISGEKVTLHWKPVGPDLTYAVFRSRDPREPATEYTEVARVSETAFEDNHLQPGAAYYYRVLALTRDNRGGPESSLVKVVVPSVVAEPPLPITDLSAVRLSKDRVIVCWRKSPEDDAARYFLYRREGEGDIDLRDGALATIPKSGNFLETYQDHGLQPGHTYTYEVFAENWTGLRQAHSPRVVVTTPGYPATEP